jgi:c-Myc-binding protein
MEVQQKKQEFQKYLEKNGVIDHITQVLVGLYEQPNRPANPMDYVKEQFGSDPSVNTDELKETVEKQKAALSDKDNEIAQLREQIAQLQAGNGAEAEPEAEAEADGDGA